MSLVRDGKHPVGSTRETSAFDQLQGVWRGVEAGHAGKCSLTVKDNTIYFKGVATREWYRATFELVPGSEPLQFRSLITECPFAAYVGKTSIAILAIDGDRLSFVGNKPGDMTPPRGFEGGGHSRHFVFNKVKADSAATKPDVEDRSEAAIPPGSPHEFVVYDPRLDKKEVSYFGIDAKRLRNNYNGELTPKLDVADAHQTDASVIAWAKKHRMDAVGRVVLADGKITQLGLRTFDLFTVPAAADAWEKLTPAEIAEKIKEGLSEWGFISMVNDLLTEGKAPETFIFQTREGSQGLLQITGAAEKNGVKIRYKVTKAAAEASDSIP
ncbi:MAG: hypothetical protein ABIZ56_08335 [Chthoniobacteraceae bacterium]